MIANFEQTGASQIMVEPVAEDMVNQYGVVDIAGVKLQAGDSAVIKNMVEKPPVDEAPSNLAITGRYVLSEKIWDLLEFTPPGAGGEIQLTDALHQLKLIDAIDAYRLTGKSHDCGSKLGYLMANVEYTLRCNNLGAEFKQSISQLMATWK
jgi:UTP--glucose-1-phosphate uridylyltransferase